MINMLLRVVAIIVLCDACHAQAEELHLDCDVTLIANGGHHKDHFDIDDNGVITNKGDIDSDYTTNTGVNYFRKNSSKIEFGVGNSNGTSGMFETVIDRKTGEYGTFHNGTPVERGMCVKVNAESGASKF